MHTLDDIALSHHTDKSSGGHGYTRTYERLLGGMRYHPLRLLELGVWEGASLRTWRDYLPNATILAVDKHDRGVEVNGVEIIITGQDDPAIAERGPFDIVIDDASHLSSLTIASFRNLWPQITRGGMYVIEDLQTSYDTKHYGSEASDNPTTGHTAMNFLKRLADEVNRSEFPREHWLHVDHVDRVEFVTNMCIVHKAS